MLRDILCQLPRWGTWPCDEINYIWRYGNARERSDALRRDHARPAVKRYIEAAFLRLARSKGVRQVVEKTCANCLRVGFVDEVFPSARFIVIVRDGRDAVSSAMERWTADLDWRYLARKARFVPPSDVPYYGFRFFAGRLRGCLSKDGVARSWGPRFEGMSEILAERGLAAVCAHQWRECVESVEAVLPELDSSRILRVRYEDFVQDPEDEIARIGGFFGAQVDQAAARELAAPVHAESVGRWEWVLTGEEAQEIEDIVRSPLRLLGHGPDSGAGASAGSAR
jgi:hypothetical protein